MLFRDHWTPAPREGLSTFWTLGQCLYQDAGEDGQGLERHGANPTVVIEHEFALPLAQIRSCLADLLKADIVLDKNLPPPGFHIFGKAHSVRYPEGGSMHRDLQWRMSTRLAGASRHLSFTLPVALPAAGATTIFYERVGVEQPVVHHLGRMVIHDGTTQHRIGPVRAKPHEFRITLQGHVALWGGGGVMYW